MPDVHPKTGAQVRLLAPVLALLLAVPGPRLATAAEGSTTAPITETTAPVPASLTEVPPQPPTFVDRARRQLDHLSVHGFVNQAFAIADGPQIHGITDRGTANYRTAALQIGYQPTPADRFVFQIQHRALGKSPLNAFSPPIDLDWVFYERRFLDQGLSVKAGRIQIPIGIFNEIRDVGTLLPLYRAPVNIYQEGLWMSETMDGAAFSTDHDFGDWSLATDLYVGFWNMIVVDSFTVEYTETDLDGGVGARIWIGTPLDGLRLGGSAYRADWPDNQITSHDTDVLVMAMGSLEYVHDFFDFRSEYQQLWFNSFDGITRAYYVQLVLPVYKGLNLVGQADYWWITTPVAQQTQALFGLTSPEFETQLNRDYVAGIKYDANKWLSIKLEAHQTHTIFSETESIILFIAPQKRSRYAIGSVAFSF